MKKLLKFTALSLSSIVSLTALSTSYATSYQIFPAPNFANAAALNAVKQAEIMIGGLTLAQQMRFTGTAAGVPTNATSRTTPFLPYGRIAMRLSPQIVVGVDITQPYFTDIAYPTGTALSSFATSTYVRDTNISPKISYQVNPKLALGAGLDFNNIYNGQLNFSAPPFGVITNRADSWATGFDLGLFYVAARGTFINLAYYSQIIQHANGVSTWGPLTNNGFSADVKLPATAILNVIQMLSPIWAVSGTIRYTNWNSVQYLVLQNTALPGASRTVTIPNKFYDNFSYELATHYNFNDKWAGLAAFDYEPNVVPTYTRNPGLPTYTRYTPAVGAEYMIAKGLKAKLIYAYPFVNAPIDLRIASGLRATGKVYTRVNAWDFGITYDI